MDRDSAGQADIEGASTARDGSAGSSGLYLAPPPRDLPLPLRLGLLFRTPLAGFCWFFIGFGMIFVWAFTLSADFTSPLFLAGRQTVQGTIVGVRQTRFTNSDDHDDNQTPVMAYKYVYVTPDGTRHSGTAYSDTADAQAGDVVDVEYASAHPWISRVAGMRGKPIPMLFGLLPVIFPIFGLVLLVREVQTGVKALRLAKIGRLAYGVRKAKKATGEEINDKRVYEYAFEFKADNLQTYTVKARTSQTRALENQKREALLYDPADPTYAAMFDTLPGSPVIAPDGSLRPSERAWARLIMPVGLPLLTVVGHGLYICCKFLR